MQYKNYTAEIKFSPEDNLFYGKVTPVTNLISFHGESVAELRKNFEAAVDDYEKTCDEIGKKVEPHPVLSLLASGKNLISILHNQDWARLPENLQDFELAIKFVTESIGKEFKPHRLSSLNVLYDKQYDRS